MFTTSVSTSITRPALVLALAGLAFPAAAMDFKLGDEVAGKLDATLTAGTTVRTEAPDPNVLGTLSTARVGLPPGQLGGNSGGNDLNFKKGRPVSTVVKGLFDLELSRRNLGVFARAQAWHDIELQNGDRAYGNIPNGFRQNAPLSDAGFAAAAKFSNVQWADVYAFGRFDVGGEGATLDLRGGRQVVNWGVSRFFAGGIDAINPIDYPARLRPGALPQEGKVPVGMIYANLAAGKAWGVDAFAQYEFRPSVLPQCGTFFAHVNHAAIGCNYVSVLGAFGVNDPTALASGRYPKRNPDIEARDSGQFGAALRFGVAALRTEFRAYAMTYHSRMPSTRVTLANVGGGYGDMTTTRLTDPNGIKYAALYVEDIRLYGLSFASIIDPSLRAFGEIAYRPNQPLNLNASDLITTFLTRSATAALNLAKNTNAIAPGGTFDAYDRFKVTTASLGANKVFPGAMGAARTILSGELGWSHVAGLPDHGFLRYGRSEDYGTAAVNGGPACTDTTAAKKACALDGFVTSNAWGYRLHLSANYPGAFFGGMLTPSLTFAHDVSGYSYDGTFSKARKTLRPGVRAEWNNKYFADIQYTRIAGGAYNTQIDRDTVTLAVGVRL